MGGGLRESQNFYADPLKDGERQAVAISQMHDSMMVTSLYLFPVALVTNDHKQWLKTTEMYSPTLLEAKSQKSVSLGQSPGAGRAALPPEAVSGESVPHFSQLLVAAGIPRLMAPSLQFLLPCHIPPSSSVCVIKFLSYKRMAVKAHPQNPE